MRGCSSPIKLLFQAGGSSRIAPSQSTPYPRRDGGERPVPFPTDDLVRCRRVCDQRSDMEGLTRLPGDQIGDLREDSHGVTHKDGAEEPCTNPIDTLVLDIVWRDGSCGDWRVSTPRQNTSAQCPCRDSGSITRCTRRMTGRLSGAAARSPANCRANSDTVAWNTWRRSSEDGGELTSISDAASRSER